MDGIIRSSLQSCGRTGRTHDLRNTRQWIESESIDQTLAFLAPHLTAPMGTAQSRIARHRNAQSRTAQSTAQSHTALSLTAQSTAQCHTALSLTSESRPQIKPRLPEIRFRVLVIGRANAGKTSILQRVCETTESPTIYRGGKEVRH